MSVMNIGKDNFGKEVMGSEMPVILDFWAPWCGPCRMVAPVLDEIAQERNDIKVCKINIDEELELAKEFQIISIPTLMVIKDGKIINKSTGTKSKEKILEMI